MTPRAEGRPTAAGAKAASGIMADRGPITADATNAGGAQLSDTLLAREVLDALQRIAQAIGGLNPDQAALAQTVRTLAAASEPVICTGVGKSGFIMAKMAATLNSLGIRAVHLNPTDALHGDLGIVAPGAVVVLMSNSGSTAELLQLLPTLKARGCTLIAILGRADSPLGREAAVMLDHGPVAEIDANGLAPTASTVVQLALADALAAAASRHRGFTAEDFHANHPAGLLGRLFLRVEAVMRPRARVPAVAAGDPVTAAMAEMTTHGLGCAAVVDDGDVLLGLLTDGDIRRAIARRVDLYAARVSELMQPDPVVVCTQERVQRLLQPDGAFSRHPILPVLDGARRLRGMLVATDLI